MIKKIILFLLIVPFVLGEVENYNVADSLDLDIKIGSDIKLSGYVDFLKITLKYFPREDYRQEILEMVIKPEDKAKVKFGEIEFKWHDINDKISYSYEGNVKVRNEINKVKERLSFPINIVDEDVKRYAEATEFIDINADIINKANEIVKDENDLYFAVFKIAEWVRQNVRYDLSTSTADAIQKSSWVLKNREGVCDEITNLFISMLRSQGIPARFVGGVAYTNIGYKFGNHGWAEVYFPGIGWIPFDVTYGQYGWIDPSHVKLAENYDSGESSVDYSWRPGSVKIKSDEVKVETDVIKEGNRINPLTRIEINPLRKEVDFGSYVPLEVTVENLQDYYLPLGIRIFKSPALLEENIKYVLLKPREKKKLYWIIKVDDLDKNYVYTSELSVETNFGGKGNSEIVFGKGYDHYNRKWAEETVNKLRERERKDYFADVDFKCSLDKEYYYSNETAKVNCFVRSLKDEMEVRVCLNMDCRNEVIGEKEVNFDLDLKGLSKISLSVENNDKVRYASVNLNVIKIPNVEIINPEIKTIDYYEREDFIFTIISDSYIKDVYFILLGKEVKLDDFDGKYEVKISLRGKELMKGLNYKLRYSDEVENEYSYNGRYEVGISNIRDVPWYVKLGMWFRDLI